MAYKGINLSDPIERFKDLQKQGFMRTAYKVPKTRKERKPVEIVACDRCRNWHPKGKHLVNQP